MRVADIERRMAESQARYGALVGALEGRRGGLERVNRGLIYTVERLCYSECGRFIMKRGCSGSGRPRRCCSAMAMDRQLLYLAPTPKTGEHNGEGPVSPQVDSSVDSSLAQPSRPAHEFARTEAMSTYNRAIGGGALQQERVCYNGIDWFLHPVKLRCSGSAGGRVGSLAGAAVFAFEV